MLIRDHNNCQQIRDIFDLFDRFEVLRLDNILDQILMTVENFKTFIEISFEFNIEKLKINIMSFINENINYLHRNNFEDIQDFNDRTDNKLSDVLTKNVFDEKQ